MIRKYFIILIVLLFPKLACAKEDTYTSKVFFINKTSYEVVVHIRSTTRDIDTTKTLPAYPGLPLEPTEIMVDNYPYNIANLEEKPTEPNRTPSFHLFLKDQLSQKLQPFHSSHTDHRGRVKDKWLIEVHGIKKEKENGNGIIVNLTYTLEGENYFKILYTISNCKKEDDRCLLCWIL